MISQEQANRHKALDVQWGAVRALQHAAASLKMAVDIAGMDPSTETDLRLVEEIIADIRERHPR
jgi:hypothetical protein